MIKDNTLHVSVKLANRQLSIPVSRDFFQKSENTDVNINTKRASDQQAMVFLRYKTLRTGSELCDAKTACCAYIFKNDTIEDQTLVMFAGVQMEHPFDEKRAIRRKLRHTATERLAIRPSSFLCMAPQRRYELEPLVFSAYFKPASRGIRPIGGNMKFTSYYIGIRNALDELLQTSNATKSMYNTIIAQLMSSPSVLVPVHLNESEIEENASKLTMLSFSNIATALQLIQKQ